VRRTLPGVQLIPELAGAIAALEHWRAHAAAAARSGLKSTAAA